MNASPTSQPGRRPRRVLLIVNPAAGTHRCSAAVGRVLSLMVDDGCVDVTVRATQGHGDAARLAAEAVAEPGAFDLVMAAGGDGTVNEAASALRDTGMPLAIVPCGSGNGLARHIGLTPGNIDEAVRVALGGKAQAIDHGLFNGRPFFCTCGVGFDAQVSEEFAHSGGRGLINYVKSAISTMAAFSPSEYTITVDDVEITRRAFLVAVANAEQYGNNAYIAPGASVTDGLLDVTVMRQGNLLQSALAGLDLMTGHLDRNTLVDSFRARHVHIVREEAGVAHIDGEPLDAPREIDIVCRPGSLLMMTP